MDSARQLRSDGAWDAVVHIVTAPGRAFEVIGRRRPIFPPLLVLGLILAGGAALVGQLYALEGLELAQSSPWMKRLAEGRPEVASELERQVQEARNPGLGLRALWILQSLAEILIPPILGLLLLAAAKLGGGELSFRSALSLALYASVISIGLATLVRTPLILAKGEALSVTTGLALLVPDAPVTSKTFRLLAPFDLFTIWGTILAGLGLAKIGAVGRGYALVVCGFLFLLFAAVGYGLGGLFA